MRYFLFISLLLLSTISLKAQSDEAEIRQVLNDFIEGTSYNNADKIRQSFLPDSRMFLANDADTLLIVSSDLYASWYDRRPGQYNNRDGKIIALDIELNVAYAKLQVDMQRNQKRYYDLILLKKVEGAWKIIAKCTSAEPIPKTPKELRYSPQKEIILDGLNHPWSMAFVSEYDAIIAEKDGQLLRVDLKTKKREGITGLPKDVARAILIDTAKYETGVFFSQAHGKTVSYNAGWFQVLLDPDFKNNSYLYLSYAAENSKKESALKIVRGKLVDNELLEVETLLLADAYSHGLFHYGGGMVFGGDGKLYISTGERNLYEYRNPPLPLSQDLKEKRGKIFRINPDGSIPKDNPGFGPDAVKGLYALGIRATQGLTLQPETNQIWFSEHGTIQGDEINILQAGANYGWPYKTSGKYRTRNYNPVISEGLEFADPIHFWDQTVAPTGLCFYTGRAFPMWKGDLIVPGLSKGSLWRMIVDGDEIVGAEELLIKDRVRLRKAVMSPFGKLYLLSDEDDGKLILLKNGK